MLRAFDRVSGAANARPGITAAAAAPAINKLEKALLSIMTISPLLKKPRHLAKSAFPPVVQLMTDSQSVELQVEPRRR
jgi:hypothetical protein